MRCAICLERQTTGPSTWCRVCAKNYDRNAFDQGGVLEAIEWAVARALRFERRRQKRRRQ